MSAAATLAACGDRGDSGGNAGSSPTLTIESAGAPAPTVRPPRAVTSAESDREALVAFYNATGGEDWDDSGLWLSRAPIGSWKGVTTDEDGRVMFLELGGAGLSGEIPPELGNLSQLKSLSLSSNGLSGEIPAELGNLANLRWLALSYNQLSGEIPPELGNLSNLEELDLRTNDLSGEIPVELGRLANLRWLEISFNRLSGGIPPELGNLIILEELHLHDNDLKGEVPPELGNLANLRWLLLNRNDLIGCAPQSLKEREAISRATFGAVSFVLGGLPYCGE